MNIIGYCKECSTIIRHEDKIEDIQIYECSKCKHPQTAEEVEFGPFEVKKPEEENIVVNARMGEVVSNSLGGYYERIYNQS